MILETKLLRECLYACFSKEKKTKQTYIYL